MGFTDLLDELRSSTKLTDKKEVLWYHLHGDDVSMDFNRYLLQETFDPKNLHNVKLTKRDLPESGNVTLEEVKEEVFTMFQGLKNSYSSKDNKIRVQNVLIDLTEEDQIALLGVVNKKLQCGVGIATINNVVDELIPVTPIQLANKYNPKKKYKNTHWYASYKMDGRRIFGIREEGVWKIYSRYKDYLGSEITTLDHFKPELEILYEAEGIDFVDGEAYNHGMAFEEIESLVSSDVNKKDTTSLKFNIFAMGDGRLKNQNINFVYPSNIFIYTEHRKFNYLTGVEQELIENTPDAIYAFLEKAILLGYEGIILRSADEWYDYKRSDLILKVKTSDTTGTEIVVDCYVEDIEYGDFVVREDGEEKIEWLPVRLLVTLIDDYQRGIMKIGSGFSLDQRRAWKEDEPLIVDKTIEAICQGFGSKGKMRFPRLHRIREDL